MVSTMRFHLGLMLLAGLSDVVTSKGTHLYATHDELRPYSHHAYHDVEEFCADDVQALCVVPDQPPMVLFLSGDPFLDWMLAPVTSEAPAPPQVNDVDLFIDQMIASILMSAISSEESSTTVVALESSPSLVDVGVARLAAEKEPEEIPQLAHQLQKYGSILMHDSEEGSEHHRMARRLTEMDAATINYHVQLPFGRSNSCLKDAYERESVSTKCAHSIRMLEQTFVVESDYVRHFQNYVKKVNGIAIYNIFVFFSLALFAYYIRWSRSAHIRLNKKIIQAVYQNPAIQRQVELEIGESIGHVESCDSHCVKRKRSVQTKNLMPSEKMVYEGVPLQVV